MTDTLDPWAELGRKLGDAPPPDPRDDVEPVECELCGSLRAPDLEQCPDCCAGPNVASLAARRERRRALDPEIYVGDHGRVVFGVPALDLEIIIPSAAARRWAAELLDAADTADGSMTPRDDS